MWKYYIIGILFSIAALWIFFTQAPPDQMLAAFAHMKAWYLIPVIAIYLFNYAIRAYRWKYLIKPVGDIPFKPLFSAVMLGYLANNILPAHLGEIVRAVVIGRSEKISISASMATIVMERVYDGLTILLMLLIVVFFMDVPDWLRLGGWAGLAFFGGVLVVLQAFRWQKERSLKVLALLLRPLPHKWSKKILNTTEAFAQGLAISSAKDLLMVGVLSIALWANLTVWAWLLMPAFSIHLGLINAIFIEVVLALALVIPAAPGFVGTFHLGAQMCLVGFGISDSVAGSYAMMLWLTHFVPTTIVGLYYLRQTGMSISSLTKYKEQAS